MSELGQAAAVGAVQAAYGKVTPADRASLGPLAARFPLFG